MISLVKLIRLPNLIIVAATQYLMRFAIINSILQFYNNNSNGEFHFSLQVSEIDFFILVLSTVCLTAAGYVINDYFDTKTDRLNRSKKMVIVGNTISRRTAMTLHLVLNAIGVVGGAYVSWKIGHIKFGFIFILVAGVLWYYSTTYKRQLLIGNIIVAVLTAMVPLMVILYELPMLNLAYSEIMLKYNQSFLPMLYWVSVFAIFAFLTTLIREIIKDIEDFEGDAAYGRNTLPIVWGVMNTKIIIIFLLALTLSGIIYLFSKFLQESQLTLWYLIIAILLPIILLTIKIIIAKNKNDYKVSSLLMKLIMMFGLGYSIIAAYIFQNIT